MNAKTDDIIVNKQFLKRNEFADLVQTATHFLSEYKAPALLLLVALLSLIVGVPAYRYYRDNRVDALNRKFYEATKNLKKETAYEEILASFTGLPASKLAALKLAEHHISHDATDKALQILDKTLTDAQPDIMGTLLALKKIDVLRSQGKHKDAAAFAGGEAATKVLPEFRSRLKLIQAESALDASDRDTAKATYESLVNGITALKDGAKEGDFDPESVNEAKERLLLMKLGKL